ncbi:MAG: GTP 3',8-cyclase MoaA [Bacteroidia bacterium]|nr:GTP 3',8-cyclase MoaA [Bacteroidia bacterium]
MKQIVDNHGRPINYVRLAVTDRCNLRCFYCMPEHGIDYMPKKDLLTFEEIEKLMTLLAGMGVTKVRLTGGEPFVRTDLMDLIKRIRQIDGITDVHLTTNGVLTAPYVPELAALGIASVNLSLDTLDRERFKLITRRDVYDDVMVTFDELLKHRIPVKINAVVIQDKNIEDIVPLVELTRTHPVSVRFIEEMPFNGEGQHYAQLRWNYRQILGYIAERYPAIRRMDDPLYSTAYHYHIPGHQGNIGIIAALSRTFCGTCNRIRVTAQGTLKTCLYDDGVLDVRALLRGGASDDEITDRLLDAFHHRAKDGHEAEHNRINAQPLKESMSTIGG